MKTLANPCQSTVNLYANLRQSANLSSIRRLSVGASVVNSRELSQTFANFRESVKIRESAEHPRIRGTSVANPSIRRLSIANPSANPSIRRLSIANPSANLPYIPVYASRTLANLRESTVHPSMRSVTSLPFYYVMLLFMCVDQGESEHKIIRRDGCRLGVRAAQGYWFRVYKGA